VFALGTLIRADVVEHKETLLGAVVDDEMHALDVLEQKLTHKVARVVVTDNKAIGTGLDLSSCTRVSLSKTKKEINTRIPGTEPRSWRWK